MFQKGVSGNPGGRPKGAKAHIRRALPLFEQLSIEPLKLAIESIKQVKDPYAQAKLWLELAGYIHPKSRLEQASKTPEDSVDNAKAVLKELKALETNDTKGTDTASVESGPSTI